MARIMICDDAAIMVKSLALNLTKMGHKVVAETSDGQDAVKSFREEKPDLVLMDISMPVKSGIDALKEILKIDPGAIVIMVSGLGYQETVLQAIKEAQKTFLLSLCLTMCSKLAFINMCLHQLMCENL